MIIQLKPEPGETIQHACRMAARLATELRVGVRFKFNGTQLQCPFTGKSPTLQADELITAYYAACSAKPSDAPLGDPATPLADYCFLVSMDRNQELRVTKHGARNFDVAQWVGAEFVKGSYERRDMRTLAEWILKVSAE